MAKQDSALDENIARVEAVLFAAGEPVAPDRLALAASLSAGEVSDAVRKLERRYNVSGSGLAVLFLDNRVQIVTRAEYAEYVRAILDSKRPPVLTQAGMEAMALVAYNQPVTRAFVEQVRGIDSNGVMSTLAERGLIEEAGRLELPGRPITYKTTDLFLRCFNLNSLADLPREPLGDAQLTLDE